MQYVTEKITDEMIINFREKEKFSEENKFSIKVSMQNELVKKCLFGTNMNV